MKARDAILNAARIGALGVCLLGASAWVWNQTAPASMFGFLRWAETGLVERATVPVIGQLNDAREKLSHEDSDVRRTGERELERLVAELGPDGRNLAAEDRLGPTLLDALVALQHQAWQRQEYARSVRFVDMRLRLQPNNLDARIERAHLQFLQGDRAEAFTAIEIVHRLVPESDKATRMALQIAQQLDESARLWQVVERAAKVALPGLWQVFYKSPYCEYPMWTPIQYDLLQPVVDANGVLVTVFRLPPGTFEMRLDVPDRPVALRKVLLERLAGDPAAQGDVTATNTWSLALDPTCNRENLDLVSGALVRRSGTRAFIEVPVDPPVEGPTASVPDEEWLLNSATLPGDLFRFSAVVEYGLPDSLAEFLSSDRARLLQEQLANDGPTAAALAALRARALVERHALALECLGNDGAWQSTSILSSQCITGNGPRVVDAFRRWNASLDVPCSRFAIQVLLRNAGSKLRLKLPSAPGLAWGIDRVTAVNGVGDNLIQPLVVDAAATEEGFIELSLSRPIDREETLEVVLRAAHGSVLQSTGDNGEPK